MNFMLNTINKNGKGVGMECPKVCKQGRVDDIKVKVNIQSPIPASFTH